MNCIECGEWTDPVESKCQYCGTQWDRGGSYKFDGYRPTEAYAFKPRLLFPKKWKKWRPPKSLSDDDPNTYD